MAGNVLYEETFGGRQILVVGNVLCLKRSKRKHSVRKRSVRKHLVRKRSVRKETFSKETFSKETFCRCSKTTFNQYFVFLF